MKISILLPYKENFSPIYPGAVSIFLNSVIKLSKHKKDTTVYLKLERMKIGFGGIGKGYAADKAKELLKINGVVSGIINASGDMNTWGKQVDGTEWKVGITNPLNKNKVFALKHGGFHVFLLK